MTPFAGTRRLFEQYTALGEPAAMNELGAICKGRQGGQMTANPKPSYSLAQIPRGVWVLGFVSMLMDISSEMIHALLPLYLVTGLGASVATVGFIEGFAVATAMVTRLFSGMLSDWFGN